MKKEHPLGFRTPYAWIVEPVHGCNLRCGHCSHALDPPGLPYQFMTEKTWKDAFKILNAISPTCRVDLCLSGEPTLHPDILAFISIARKIAPKAQIQITTNGTMLRKGKITYQELFAAGINIVYTDMYGPKEFFMDSAKKSGVFWYEYYNHTEKVPSPWTYHGPEIQMIILQEQPENWPESRFRAGLLGTFCNNLDWEKAKRFGLYPVTIPPKRRCNQPFIYVPIHASGDYLLCCQDNMGESRGIGGNVFEGIDGFENWWLGKNMQTIRRRLRNKNRIDTTYCSRCSVTHSRCDYILWKKDTLMQYKENGIWKKISAEKSSSEKNTF